MDLFNGCRAKVDRAAEIHSTLVPEFLKWVSEADGGTPFAIQYQPTRGAITTVRLIIEQPIPERFSVVAGDVFHNLRSSLDHVVARIKEAHGQSYDDGHFPITTHRNEFPNSAARNLAGISEDSDAWKLIESVQPFHDEDPQSNPLRVIQRMNNVDKHQLVHAAYIAIDVEKGQDMVEVVRPRNVRVVNNGWVKGQPMDNGTVLASYLLRPGARAEETFRRAKTPAVALQFGRHDEGKASFEDCIAAVRDIVDRASDLGLSQPDKA